MNEAQEFLLKAAELLGEKGWVQGSFHNADGFCAIGAIDNVARYRERRGYYDAIYLLAAQISSYGDSQGTITAWNDMPERTAEDVILAMKKAANA